MNKNYFFVIRWLIRISQLVLFLPVALDAQNQKISSKELAAEVDKLNWEAIDLSNDARYLDAAGKLQKAITLDDTRSARSYHNIAYTYELAGDKNKALENYQKAVVRNPNQTISWASLGKMQYTMGLYKDAVSSGETTLKLDPHNVPVSKWLPDAYAKLAEQKMHDLNQSLAGDPKTNPNCEQRPEVIAEIGTYGWAIFNFDKQSTALALHRQAGIATVPWGVYAEFNPLKELTFRLNGDSPYFGALQPTFYAGRQTIELQYNFKYFFLGTGLIFSQLNVSSSMVPFSTTTYIQNSDYNSLSDSKFGFIFGGRDEISFFALKIFPRYLLRDGLAEPKSTQFDVAKIDLEYRRNLRLGFGSTVDEKQSVDKGPHTYLIFKTSIDEVYLTEYKATAAGDNLGHYFGTYDISLGMEFGKLRNEFDTVSTTWGLLLTERLYFQDTGNTSGLASFGNGQGYFGFSTSGMTSGTPFASYRSNSFIMTAFASQMIKNRFVIKEAFMFEITKASERNNAFGFNLSLGYRF